MFKGTKTALARTCLETRDKRTPQETEPRQEKPGPKSTADEQHFIDAKKITSLSWASAEEKPAMDLKAMGCRPRLRQK
jgi:hypothetical protein